MPYPLTSNGYIDEAEVFYLIVGLLKLPIDSLNDLTPEQFFWLLKGYARDKQEKYELIAYAVQVGYVRANGKRVEMFKKANTATTGTISKEHREKELEQLGQLFGTTE